ncbi:MAG: ATP-binding cassette domain-containing protein, partial [Bacteriovoracaceae bacterium]
FMDSVTTHTMGIYRKGLKKIKGGTAKFYEQMELEDEIYEKTRANQEKKKEHLESFVERFRAQASKASQAQSKLKQLNKMQSLDALEDEGNMGLRFRYQECPGKELMRGEKLGFGYDEELLFSDVSFGIGRKDRIGIIGKNGKGKSTLLNLLAGELSPVKGELSSHPSLAIGHLGQTNVARLNEENTIVQEVQEANLDLSQTAVRNICGSLMFEGELANKKIKILSGGEKNRTLLGKILANKTNLLLLDEPTNHLDMESIEILGQEIRDYPGAVVMVTHSESLLREVAERLIVFTNNGAQYFLGGYDEFLEKIGWEEEEKLGRSGNKTKKLTKKEAHALRQDIIKERSKVCNPLLKKQSSLEQKALSAEEELEQAQKVLDEAVKSGDNQEILENSQKVGQVEKEIQKLFELMEEIENELLSHNKLFDTKLERLEK